MVNLEGIKNIIFDLGDVIININHELVYNAFKQLFKNDFERIENDLKSNQIIEKYEIGKLSTFEFISFFKSYNPKLSDIEIIRIWNSMLLDIPIHRLNLINRLASKYRIFLLSNTNETHIKYIDDYVKKQFGLSSMAVPFEKAYYSHQLGLRKPNPKIFETILFDKELLPNETLFIDDSEEHIIAAKQLNLRTHHLLESETILDIFNAN